MLGRALSLATVTLLIACFAADPARAQNLEAGKSPSQIFAGTCTACHKGPRGLLKTVPAGSLQGFLRQHYTTSPEMASLLAGFLVSNGAADTRLVGGQPKPARDEKLDARPGAAPEQLDRFGRRQRPAPPQEAARPEAEPREAGKPDADGLHGRNARRLARPGEALPREGQGPAQAASERGADGRKLSAKQRLGKQGKPESEEPPKTEAVKTDTGNEEPAKNEAVKEDTPKSETAKVEGAKPGGSKPSGEGSSESAKIEVPNKNEAPNETGSSQPPALRADPVPPVTPAPPVSATASGGAPESAASGPSAAAPAQPAPPAVTASVPPPVAPAGPPAPPISQ